MTPDLHDDDRALAAELALGLLDGEDRATALRRVLAEPAFAAAVEEWRVRVAHLFDLWPDAVPPPDLIERIDAGLDGGPGGMPVARPRRAPWPLIATAMTAVAAGLLAVIVVRPDAPPPGPAPASTVPVDRPALVAGIAAGPATVGALYRPDTGELRVAASAVAPAGRVAELWVIAGDAPPYALGLVGPRPTVIRLTPADRARIAAGATLALSIEPPGGSPTGAPTGPVVGTGGLSAV